MTDWLDIAALDDVPQRGARVVKTADGCVAVFRTASDEVYALNNSCPHKGGPLSEGIVHGASVTCPLHNWVFSLESGEAQGADVGSVQTYATRIESRRILLEKSALVARTDA